MKTNPHLADAVYKQVGEEMARKEFSPGAMARAVAEADGNKARAESLYAKFRFEELVRELEREAVTEAQRRQNIEQQARERKRQNIFDCPCGFSGKAKIKARGSILITLILLCVYVVPGLIYALVCSGYKAVCPNCGRLLADRVRP
jgi:predicted RNA-binding Zn-ribbon protein involved in translation (DUF1610 family)